MPTSQNGWSVFTSPPSGTIPEYITGRVRPEDVDVVFTYLCDRIHNEVEKIKVHWSWGWAFRAIRGAISGYSNHASATAIDINAPAHPLGVTGTWSSSEKDKINEILRDLDGIVRWGENYSGRKDGMHFEIDAGAAAVRRVADRIRNNELPGQKKAWRPKNAKAVHFGRVQEQFLIAAGAQEGEIVRLNGVGLIQRALNRADKAGIDVDGLVGPATLNAWGRWEAKVGPVGRPRVPDRKSVEALAEEANLRIVGEPWDKPDVEPEPEPEPDPEPTINDLAVEVIEGRWGNGEERRRKLTKAGHDYDKVQARVRKILG